MYKESDILYETSNYFVIKVKSGVEVYKIGVTYATRCARICLGDKSLARGILECNKREDILRRLQ